MCPRVNQYGQICNSPASKLWLVKLLTATLVVQFVFSLTSAANAEVIRISENPSKVAITDDARAKASDIFTERCAACHGAEGHGNGPAAANLKPKPIDFHNQNWQKSVTDDTMTKAIIFGGRSVGKSGQMAPNPDLQNEPAIVAALVEKIRRWSQVSQESR
jgi:mono/diheme cytochrome c family protein